MSASCNHFHNRISEYLDGRLAEKERGAFEAHLRTCAKCSEEVSALRQTLQRVKTLKSPPMPEGLTAKISAAVHQHVKDQTAPGFGPARRNPWQTLRWVAPAFGLLMLGFLTWQYMPDTHKYAPPTAVEQSSPDRSAPSLDEAFRVPPEMMQKQVKPKTAPSKAAERPLDATKSQPSRAAMKGPMGARSSPANALMGGQIAPAKNQLKYQPAGRSAQPPPPPPAMGGPGGPAPASSSAAPEASDEVQSEPGVSTFSMKPSPTRPAADEAVRAKAGMDTRTELPQPVVRRRSFGAQAGPMTGSLHQDESAARIAIGNTAQMPFSLRARATRGTDGKPIVTLRLASTEKVSLLLEMRNTASRQDAAYILPPKSMNLALSPGKEQSINISVTPGKAAMYLLTLSSVIPPNVVTAQYHLFIPSAISTAEETISVQYRNAPATAALQDLSEQSGLVILAPVVDNNRATLYAQNISKDTAIRAVAGQLNMRIENTGAARNMLLNEAPKETVNQSIRRRANAKPQSQQRNR